MEHFNTDTLGYNKEQVNAFVDYVIKTTEQNVSTKKAQLQEIKTLQEELEKYKNDLDLQMQLNERLNEEKEIMQLEIEKYKLEINNNKTTIKATIKDATKKLLNKNVKVTVKVDGKAMLKNKVIKNGKICLSFKKALKKGNHKIIITSASTKAFNKATLKTSFKV